jgi:hypothetical protein
MQSVPPAASGRVVNAPNTRTLAAGGTDLFFYCNLVLEVELESDLQLSRGDEGGRARRW